LQQAIYLAAFCPPRTADTSWGLELSSSCVVDHCSIYMLPRCSYYYQNRLRNGFEDVQPYIATTLLGDDLTHVL